MGYPDNESMAAIIRKALDQFLTRRQPNRRSLHRQALGTVGKYTSGVGDISIEHDRYLEED